MHATGAGHCRRGGRLRYTCTYYHILRGCSKCARARSIGIIVGRVTAAESLQASAMLVGIRVGRATGESLSGEGPGNPRWRAPRLLGRGTGNRIREGAWGGQTPQAGGGQARRRQGERGPNASPGSVKEVREKLARLSSRELCHLLVEMGRQGPDPGPFCVCCWIAWRTREPTEAAMGQTPRHRAFARAGGRPPEEEERCTKSVARCCKHCSYGSRSTTREQRESKRRRVLADSASKEA